MTQSALSSARSVESPTREAMLQRAPSVYQFWMQNRDVFEQAWAEWERGVSITLDSTLYDPRLRAAVQLAWQDPTQETKVADLFEEVGPGVYQVQFFDPDRLNVLRDYLEGVADAGIPLRPPYGIALNRAGAMLDPRSEGYLAAPNFQAFYRDLMDSYMRPIARLLFPDIVGYDTQSFGFSIGYQPGTDTSLRPHTDASSVTLNINLNLPGETFSGSAVSFIDSATRRVEKLAFQPGTALIHHGSVPHAAEPILAGSRTNFVLWLYGEAGQVAHHARAAGPSAPHERWVRPNVTSDGYAPF